MDADKRPTTYPRLSAFICGLFLDQEQELSIRLLRFAHPFISPTHVSHHVPFVVDVDRLNEPSGTSDHFIQLRRRRPSAGTVGQDDVPALRFPQQPFNRFDYDEPAAAGFSELFKDGSA